MIIVRRLLWLVPVLFVVTCTVFIIARVIPGDPAQMMAGPHASAGQVEMVRHQLGLDRPLWAQYYLYLHELARLNLGRSIVSGLPVAGEIAARLPATLELMLATLIVSTAAALSLSLISSRWPGRLPDRLIGWLSVIGVSTPAFWAGMILLYGAYGKLGLFPAGGRLGPDVIPPPNATGFLLLDSLIAARWDVFTDALHHLALPVATLSLGTSSIYIRVLRTALRAALGANYVLTARAAGAGEMALLLRQALPNALLPFVTLVGLDLGHLLFGSVVVETIFAWPGMGSFALDSILELDFPVITGFAAMTSIGYVLANLAVDLVYLRLDPRIRIHG